MKGNREMKAEKNTSQHGRPQGFDDRNHPGCDPCGRKFEPGQNRTNADHSKTEARKSLAECSLRASALLGGEIGIRTRDAGFPTYRISNPALSATQPSLRYLILQAIIGFRQTSLILFDNRLDNR
jgi:hypothetical protein